MVPPGVAPVTYILLNLTGGPQTKRPQATPGGLIAATVSPSGCAPVLAHVPSFGQNPGGSPDLMGYPVPKACMHVLGTGVPRRLGVARSGLSPKAAQALGCSLTPGLRISFCRVTCIARAASVPGLWTLVFLSAEWHLCLGLGFAVTWPLLAVVLGGCAWVRCVGAGSGFCCAPPLLAGVLGCVCVCACAPLVPRHSWLGCGVWVWVFGLGFRLGPATPGWGVEVCLCLCACSACTLPLLAGVCGVGVCGWTRVLAALRHSWLGCWGVCVFVFVLRLYPATLGWGVRCGCGCFGSGFGCAPALLVWVLGCMCVPVRARLYPATAGLGLRCGGMFFGSGFGCAPPLLAGLLGCVSVSVRALPVPRHSWLGCAVWVCVLGLGFGLRPATPGSGVGLCVCLCACSPCTPPLLARVCRVGVCAWAPVSAAPPHFWLGCWD